MKKVLSVVLAACMILGLAACGNGTNSGNAVVINDVPEPQPKQDYALSSIVLPVAVSYPNEEDFDKDGRYDYSAARQAWDEWGEQAAAKEALAQIYKGKLDHYLKLSNEYLKGLDGKNAVCSPLNIYFALAMLAECAAGNTRAEILDVLGAADINELRTTAKALWEQTYYSGDGYTTELASSIWLNNNIMGTIPEFDDETLATLAMEYYATAYTGDAVDKGFSRAFKDWLNDHTGGLLKDQVESLDDFESDLVAAIATTVYFKASWADEFPDYLTVDDVFHAVAGEKTVSFMRITETLRMYTGEGYTAVFVPFSAVGGMWIMLPDEGITPEQLNADGKIFDLTDKAFDDLVDDLSDNGFDYCSVALTLPKFDVDAKIDLIEILVRMGIREAFIEGAADLSNLIKNVPAYVSDVTHAARVKIDEKGCEAAAFTVILLKAEGMLSEPVEFKVDRPFAFAITGSDGLPLFTGIVNEP